MKADYERMKTQAQEKEYNFMRHIVAEFEQEMLARRFAGKPAPHPDVDAQRITKQYQHQQEILFTGIDARLNALQAKQGMINELQACSLEQFEARYLKRYKLVKQAI